MNNTATICPDCREPVASPATACPKCNRAFETRDGICHMLPAEVADEAAKESEKAGWGRVIGQSLDELRAYYLLLPYVDDDSPVVTHYREASRAFKITQQVLGDIAGKRGLDLGGSIGWAAYRFAQAGAQMTLADYNDSSPSGLGGAQAFIDDGVEIDRYRVDAHNLPFADAQFDFVFCCAFLHHLQDPARVVREVGRVLRPGGKFVATLEAFCPWWLTKEQGLARSDMALHYVDLGINEQVFYHGEYAQWFRDAKLKMEVVSPRWDDLGRGNRWRGARLSARDYAPEILVNRRERSGVSGLVARAALATGAWRVLTPLLRMDATRTLLFSATQKPRILVGTK